MAPFFGGGKTGNEIMKGKDLTGMTAVVTGANSGIGREITRMLALSGCNVVMAVRKQASAEFAAKQLREGFPSGMKTGELTVKQCNLGSMAEIREFAAWLQQQRITIDLLVLNAAIKATPKWYTQEGHELQMGVNFLGHFHLVQLLLPTMQAQSGPSRIVCVACKNEMDGTLRMSDLNFSKVNYEPLKAYKGSKVALALLAKELARRTEGTNVTAYAADPGSTGDTMINKFMGPLAAIFIFSKPFLKSLQQAAATPLFACVAPEAGPSTGRRTSFRGSSGIKSGTLLSECKTTQNRMMANGHMAKRIWEEAEQLVSRSVLGSHAANAGFEGNESSLWVLNSVLKPMFDFILRMFGLRKY